MKKKIGILAMGIVFLMLIAPIVEAENGQVNLYISNPSSHPGETITFVTTWDNNYSYAYAIVTYEIWQYGHAGSPETGVRWSKHITSHTDYVDYSVQPVYWNGVPLHLSIWTWDQTDDDGNPVYGGDYFGVYVEVWEYTEDGTGHYVGNARGWFTITP